MTIRRNVIVLQVASDGSRCVAPRNDAAHCAGHPPASVAFSANSVGRLTFCRGIWQESFMQAALLSDRGVVKVAGEDARKFLHGLITVDMGKLAPGTPGFAALLTPQGKIIVDFIIAETEPGDGGGFLLDCPRVLAGTLVEKLNFYRLRAKVIAEDLSEALGILAAWDGSGAVEYGLCYPDPRLPSLGLRVMLPPYLADGAPS